MTSNYSWIIWRYEKPIFTRSTLFTMSTPPPSPGATPNPGSGTTSVGLEGSMSQATIIGTSQATVAPGPSNVARTPSSQVAKSTAMHTTKRTKGELQNHGGLFDEFTVKQKYSAMDNCRNPRNHLKIFNRQKWCRRSWTVWVGLWSHYACCRIANLCETEWVALFFWYLCNWFFRQVYLL